MRIPRSSLLGILLASIKKSIESKVERSIKGFDFIHQFERDFFFSIGTNFANNFEGHTSLIAYFEFHKRQRQLGSISIDIYRKRMLLLEILKTLRTYLWYFQKQAV